MIQQSHFLAYICRKTCFESKPAAQYSCITIYNSRTRKQPKRPSTDKWIKEDAVHKYNGIFTQPLKSMK